MVLKEVKYVGIHDDEEILQFSNLLDDLIET
jgi:hypothetical protein